MDYDVAMRNGLEGIRIRLDRLVVERMGSWDRPKDSLDAEIWKNLVTSICEIEDAINLLDHRITGG